MELYSKEELLKELKKEYSCGGECDHCPEVLDAGSCSVLRFIRWIIDNAQPVEIATKLQPNCNNLQQGECENCDYNKGFRDGYSQCINDREERKENSRLFQKGGAENEKTDM